MSKRKIIAATAGAVAAAAGVFVATRRGADDGAVVYHVLPEGDGWHVKAEGQSEPASRHEVKRTAVSAGRDRAHASRPSRLVIHRSDGTVQRTHSYDVE